MNVISTNAASKHRATGRSKSIFKAALAACTLLSGLYGAGAQAQEIGIFELAVRQPWEKYASKRSQCQFNAPLNQGHELQIMYLPEVDQTAINLQTNKDIFVMNRLYQADIYIDFQTQTSYNATPLSPSLIQFLQLDPDRFERLFDGIEEISFGLDNTLYVIDLSRIDFPLEAYEQCVKTKRPPAPTVASVLNELNPFARTPAEKKAEEKIEVLGPDEQLQAQADLNPPAHVEEKWKPFLTTYRPQPYRLKPQNPDAAEARTAEPAPPRMTGVQANTGNPYNQEGLPPEEKPPYDEILKYNYFQEQDMQSCGGEKTYEFTQIPPNELPENMQGLDAFMTGGNNADEDKELIQSLLVQLELLEKEKEALRRRAPEDYGPLSVIRSCGREQDTISDLKGQLRSAEDERFKLQKQQEIQDEIISAYEEIEGDDPLPAPPAESEGGQ